MMVPFSSSLPRFVLAWCLATSLCALHSHVSAVPSTGADLVQIQHAIDSLDLLRAEQLVAAIDEPALRPAALYYRGLLAFHRGEYAGAEQDINAALKDTSANQRPPSWTLMQTMASEARALLATMQMHASDNGRYRVYASPEDSLIVPYAMAALEAADRTLTQQLGVQVPAPIRLEIFSSAASLARVSPLTEQQIETSGTIALCKWNRLMITTPRALVRGYPWADTIAHELTHLFISTKTKERAPVWLQEGIAKMLERGWRSQAAGVGAMYASLDLRDATHRLDAATESMLLTAAAQKKLLPFERLHPSIAMLPSQEQAQLAFAQVSTFMLRYVTTYGDQGLRDALTKVADGEDARSALATVAHSTFANLEREWSSALSQRKPPAKHVKSIMRRLRKGNAEPDELNDVDQVAARRFVRLGDMLWSRGRNKAAAVEYRKALAIAPGDPIVTSRYGRSALQANDSAAARDAMNTLLADYPEHAPAWSVLAQALRAQNEPTQAQRAALEAILINPFDPDPHCVLAQVTTGSEQQREQQACRALR